jgi:hypothetical protein
MRMDRLVRKAHSPFRVHFTHAASLSRSTLGPATSTSGMSGGPSFGVGSSLSRQVQGEVALEYPFVRTVVQSCQGVRGIVRKPVPNPSIERTPYSGLRPLPGAAHVER